MYRILLANGVNLDLLGARPKAIYGERTLKDLEAYLHDQVPLLENILKVQCSLVFFQSNDEASYLAKISETWDGMLLNPGAWTHTSLALSDRLEALQVPFVELHLSQLAQREPWRQESFCARHAVGVVYGFGFDSYLLALHGLLRHISSNEAII